MHKHKLNICEDFSSFHLPCYIHMSIWLDVAHTKFIGAAFIGGKLVDLDESQACVSFAHCNYNGTQKSKIFHSKRASQPLNHDFLKLRVCAWEKGVSALLVWLGATVCRWNCRKRQANTGILYIGHVIEKVMVISTGQQLLHVRGGSQEAVWKGFVLNKLTLMSNIYFFRGGFLSYFIREP